MRRFKLLWTFTSLYEHIKRRGRREHPLAITIDEFSAMAFKVTEGTNPLAELLDECIQQYLRGQNIWLTVAHQSIDQIDEQLRNTLFSLGTYIFGRVATMREARILADVLFRVDPYRVKHYRNVWGSAPNPRGTREPLYFVIDVEPEFLPMPEQQELYAQHLTKLGLFHFFCRPAISEGEVSESVIPITIANIDRDPQTGEYQFPNAERIAQVRAALEPHSGIPVDSILKEQENRLLETTIWRTPPPAQTPRRAEEMRRPGVTTPEKPQSVPDPAHSQHPTLPAGRQGERRHQRWHKLS
jgi:hypothetical protein